MILKKPPYLGVAYYPEDWNESEIDRDIEKMQRIGIDTVRIAEFAWHRMEPHPGEFDFSFFHRVVDKMHAAGINVVLGTPTATPPRLSGGWRMRSARCPSGLTACASGSAATACWPCRPKPLR